MDDWLVSVVNGDKVVYLDYSQGLRDFDTIKALYRGCDVSAVRLPNGGCFSSDVELGRKKYVQALRVRCIETNAVYPSVKACSVETGISEKSIYESIRLGIKAKGFSFEYFD